MFLEPKELNSKIYTYQLSQITEGEEALITVAIESAIEESSSYLSLRYDVEKIFTSQGTDRNAHLLNVVKTLALWNIIQLANVDMIYNKVQDEYDRAINWLNRIATGRLSPNLPEKNKDQQQGFYLESKTLNNNDY